MRTDLFQRFGEAVIRFPDSPALGFVVGAEIPELERGSLIELTGAPTFAVITPCNPDGIVLAPAENAERLAAFVGLLARRQIRSVAADGWSRDSRHMEQGRACVVSFEQAIMLGREWGQLAIFWFDGSGFIVNPVPATVSPRS